MAKDTISESARRLKELRVRSGVGLRELGRAIGWEASKYQYYEDYFKRPHLPLDFVQLISPVLIGRGTPPVLLSELADLAGPAGAAMLPRPDADGEGGAAPSRGDMSKDVPVFGTVEGGAHDMQGEADFELNGEIIDYVRRPPRLRGRGDIFALYVRGLSMSPWREPGGLVYVESNRSPRAGDYVVIELKSPRRGEPVRPALVKRLVGLKGSKLRLLQYSPPKEFDLDQKQILKLYRVLDWDELLGS